MNANSTTINARGAAAQRDATVQKLEAALLAQHEQARAKLMLALNCGVDDGQRCALSPRLLPPALNAPRPRGGPHPRPDRDH